MIFVESPTRTSVPPERTAPLSRLLFFSSCPEPWGGSEELWSGTARHLARAGHHLFVYKTIVDDTHPRIIELRAAGIEIEDYYRKPKLPATKRFANRVLPYRFQFPTDNLQAERCIERMKRGRYDLAVISQGENFDGLTFVKFCRRLGLPYILVCQKASDLHWPGDDIRSEMRDAFLGARRAYFVAEHNRLLTERQIGLTLPNAEVVRNPFLTDIPAPLPYPEPIDGQLRLACVGRLLIAEKGQDMLLRVLALQKWRQRPLQVDLYGQGIHREALEDLARMIGVSNVRFCGFTRNVTDIWKEHHALVLPSRAEGLPLVLVEAMLCGRPAIVTNVGGNAEVIDDGVSGFVADGMDDAALDGVMERAWNQRHDWEAIGLEAARRIREQIPVDPCGVFAAKLEALLSEVQAEKPA